MSKKQENRQPFWKSRKLWITVGVLVILGFSYNVGYSSAEDEVAEGISSYEELESKMDKKTQELDGIKDKLKDKVEELNDKESEVDEALETIKKGNDMEEKIDKLEGDLSSKKGDLSDKEDELKALKGDIKDKEEELEKLEGDVVKAKDDPVELLSGEWIIGNDVSEGRYKASGSSNFVVHSSAGTLKVNTILGDSGDGDYVFFADEGDIITTSSQTTLTPVE